MTPIGAMVQPAKRKTKKVVLIPADIHLSYNPNGRSLLGLQFGDIQPPAAGSMYSTYL